jgi:hypothetical protein
MLNGSAMTLLTSYPPLDPFVSGIFKNLPERILSPFPSPDFLNAEPQKICGNTDALWIIAVREPIFLVHPNIKINALCRNTKYGG